MSDLDLLHAYAVHDAEPAFAQLVERHVDLVYSTALRQVADPEKAKDIVQVVFADLARQAKSRADIRLISGWLYRRTCSAAIDLMRSESRRRAREKTAMEQLEIEASTQTESVWQSVAPVLEDAMGGLCAADQDAIVLRYVENRSLREVGMALGLSEDSAQKRVSRALEKLRSILLNRGVVVSMTVLAAVMTSNALQAAPAGLSATSVTASVAMAKGTGVSAGSGLALLKSKLVLTGITAGLVVGSGGYLAFQHAQSHAELLGTGPNLIQNSGFEEGVAPWKDTKGTLSVVRSAAHSGSAAGLISQRTAPYAGPIQQLSPTVLENTTRFVCSAWVRVDQGSPQPVQITVRYDDEQGTHYITAAQGRAKPGEWSHVSGGFEIQPAGSVRFMDLFLEGPTPGVDFLVDDVVVQARK